MTYLDISGAETRPIYFFCSHCSENVEIHLDILKYLCYNKFVNKYGPRPGP